MTSHAPADTNTTEELWRDFGSTLRAFVARRVQNSDDVDDIVQEIFLRLHRNVDTVEEPTKWIYRVARNSIIDFYRSAPRRREVLSDVDLGTELPAPEEAPADVWQEFAACVEPLTRDLNETDREAVVQIDLKGRTQTAVAAELGLSVSGVKSRVQRSRQKMRAALDECCAIELDARGRPIEVNRRSDDDCC